MVQQNTAEKKHGPPKFLHLPKARGTPRIPLTHENFSRTGSPSETTQICMDPDTQNQVQVECREAQAGDRDEILPNRAGTRNYRIELFRHPGSGDTESSASAPTHQHWIRRIITLQTRETSGQYPKHKGARSHGQNWSGCGIIPTKGSSVGTPQWISREETKHEKSDERIAGEDSERDRLAEVRFLGMFLCSRFVDGRVQVADPLDRPKRGNKDVCVTVFEGGE